MTVRRILWLIMRITGWVLLLGMVFSLVAFVWYMTSAPGEELVRSELEVRLPTIIGANVSIESFETNIFTRAQLKGLAVNLPDGRPVFRLASARAGYNLFELFSFRFTLSSLELDSLTVIIERDSSGVFSLPALQERNTPRPESEKKKALIAFHIGELTLHDSRASYDDRSIPLVASLENVEARMTAPFGGGYGITIRAADGSISYTGKEVPLKHLLITASMKNNAMTLSEASVSLSGTTITAEGQADFGKSPSVVSATVAVSGDVTPIVTLTEGYIPPILNPLRGTIDATGTIYALGDSLSITLSLNGKQFGINEFDFTTLRLAGAFRDNRIVIDSLAVKTPFGGDALLTGSLTLDSLFTHNAELHLNGLSAERLWRFAMGSDSPYHGTVSGVVVSSGRLTSVTGSTLSAGFTIDDIQFNDASYDDLAVSLDYRNGSLSVSAAFDSTRFNGAFALEDSLVTGGFNGAIGNIRFFTGFLDNMDIDGTVSFHGTVSGPLRAPAVTLSFMGQDITYKGFPAARTDGSLSWQPGRFILDRTTVSGTVDDVAMLSFPPLPDGLHGGVSYRAELSFGDAGFNALVNADMSAPSFGELTFESGTAEASIKDSTVVIRSTRLIKGPLTLDFAGEYNIPGMTLSMLASAHDSTGQAGMATLLCAFADTTNMMIDFDAANIAIASLTPLMKNAPPLKGVVNGQVKFRGTPANPLLRTAATAESLAWGEIPAVGMKIAAWLDGDVIRVDSLLVDTGAGSIRGNGALSLARGVNGSFIIADSSLTTGTVTADSIDAQYLKPMFPKGIAATGSAGIQLAWDGTVGDPDFAGLITIRDGVFNYTQEASPITGISADLTLDRNYIGIERFHAESQGVAVDTQGAVTVNSIDSYDAAVDLTVNGNISFHAEGAYRDGSVEGVMKLDAFDMAALRGFVPAVTGLKGTANGVITLSGVPSLTSLTGSVAVDSLGFRPVAIHESVSNGAIRVTFNHEHVNMDTLYASFGSGSVTGKGNMTLKGNIPQEMNLSLRGANITVRQKNTYDILVKSVSLNGSVVESNIVIDGSVNFGETKITKNLSTADIIRMTRKKTARPAKPNPFLDTAKLSLQIRDSETIWIDNNLAKLQLHPELTIEGSPRAPVITGRITADEGYVVYFDREFDVTRCHLDFTDPYRNNPVLDIQAQTSIRNSQQPDADPYIITLTISGTAEESRVEMTSNPALDKTDILALLTFGVTGAELAETSSSIVQDRAMMLGSSQLSSYLSREARSFLGLDDLSIQGNLFDAGKASGPQLLASETISDRLKITYTTTVGEQNDQSIRLDYRLSKFFSVVGQTNQQGKASLDLKYRLKF